MRGGLLLADIMGSRVAQFNAVVRDRPFLLVVTRLSHTNDEGLLDYLHQDTGKMNSFNVCMTGKKGPSRHWVDWYSVRDRLLTRSDFPADPIHVCLVDMSGGKGHHLEALLCRLPESGGHLVLQDLPGTIESIKGVHLNLGIRPMVHDVFSPQSVLGAKVY